MGIYTAINGQQEGPFTSEEVAERVRYGRLDPANTYMWQEGQVDWVLLSETDILRTEHSPSPQTNKPPLPPPKGLKLIKFIGLAGVLVAYLIVIAGMSSFMRSMLSSHPADPTSPFELLGMVCAVSLFRRMLRKKTQMQLRLNPFQAKAVLYLKTYWSASWRWCFLLSVPLLLNIGNIEDPYTAGKAFAVVIFYFAISGIGGFDIPFRYSQRVKKASPSAWKDSFAGWIIFLIIIIASLALYVMNERGLFRKADSTKASVPSPIIAQEKMDVQKPAIVPTEGQDKSEWYLPVKLGASESDVLRLLGNPDTRQDPVPKIEEDGESTKLDVQLVYKNLGLSITENWYGEVRRIDVQIKPTSSMKGYEGNLPYNISRTSPGTQLGDKETIKSARQFSDELMGLEVLFKDLNVMFINPIDNGNKSNTNVESVIIRPQSDSDRTFLEKLSNIQPSDTELTPKEIYRRYAERVVQVISYDSAGREAATGTGFLMDSSTVLTNFHVIAKAYGIRCKKGGAQPIAAKVLTFRQNQDWALLSAESSIASVDLLPRLFNYAEVFNDNPDIGEAVSVIGNPEDLLDSITTGIVSGLKSNEAVKYVQISAPISHGSSGSPVFDDRGRIIGIATLAMKEGQNLNFAIPISYVVSGYQEYIRDVTHNAKAIPDRSLPLEGYRKDGNKGFDGVVASHVEATMNQFLEKYSDSSDHKEIYLDALHRSKFFNDNSELINIFGAKMKDLGATYQDWLGIGSAMVQLKDYKRAEIAYKQSLEVAEAFSPLTAGEAENRLVAISNVNFFLEHFEKASTYAELAVKQFPDCKSRLFIFQKNTNKRPATLFH